MWQGVACMAGSMCGRGHVWQGCMHGGGVHGGGLVWQGGGDMHGRGGMHTWQERLPLQRTVRILLECILVLSLLVTFMLNVKTKNR